MSERHEFNGSVEIEGNTDRGRISICFSHGNSVTIHGIEKKKTIYLQPFDVYMLRNSNSQVMKEGFYYSVSGTNVGGILCGPLGHPGDGEFDSRPMKHFDLRCKYSTDELLVEVEGVTEEGISGFDEFRDKPLVPWRLKIQFTIPRAEMKKFFGFTDFNYPFFETLLDACR